MKLINSDSPILIESFESTLELTILLISMFMFLFSVAYGFLALRKSRRLKERNRVQMLAKTNRNLSNFSEIQKGYSDAFIQSGIMEAMIPRKFESEQELKPFIYSTTSLQGKVNPSTISKVIFTFSFINFLQAISDPVWEILDREGKRWRPMICILFIINF